MRTRWDEQRVIAAAKEIVDSKGMNTFPTHTEMFDYYGNYELSNAVRRHGGTEYFARRMGLGIKECESKFGTQYELLCMGYIEDELGIPCKKTIPRYPYDLLADNCVKIDVKVSHRVNAHGQQCFTCNLEKKMPTCDLYIVFCVDGEDEKVYVIPSAVVSGHSQLSFGIRSSKYDCYLNRWDYIQRYAEFAKSTVQN